jgi:fructose transport system substrate-binding protein
MTFGSTSGSQPRQAGPFRWLVLFAVLAIALMPLFSSASLRASAQDNIIVGLITKTETNPFFVKMKEGAQQAADELGVELMTASGQFDTDNASQVTAIENMITAGVTGILITPADPTAIVPTIEKARDAGVVVIALDTPTNPQEATDALFATDNFMAGVLIGQYARENMGDQADSAQIAMLDLAPGISVGVLRHNGFLSGFAGEDPALATPGATPAAATELSNYIDHEQVVCAQDTQGDQAQGQTAMENCLQSNPDINLVYTINEPAAFGAYRALEAAGRAEDVMIVSIDGGCVGVQGVADGQIAATSQQYPLRMAQLGVETIYEYAQSGEKPTGYVDTGVTLITDEPVEGVPSEDTAFGLENCWG